MHACFDLPGRMDLSARRSKLWRNTLLHVVVTKNASHVRHPIACSLARC